MTIFEARDEWSRIWSIFDVNEYSLNQQPTRSELTKSFSKLNTSKEQRPIINEKERESKQYLKDASHNNEC